MANTRRLPHRGCGLCQVKIILFTLVAVVGMGVFLNGRLLVDKHKRVQAQPSSNMGGVVPGAAKDERAHTDSQWAASAAKEAAHALTSADGRGTGNVLGDSASITTKSANTNTGGKDAGFWKKPLSWLESLHAFVSHVDDAWFSSDVSKSLIHLKLVEALETNFMIKPAYETSRCKFALAKSLQKFNLHSCKRLFHGLSENPLGFWHSNHPRRDLTFWFRKCVYPSGSVKDDYVPNSDSVAVQNGASATKDANIYPLQTVPSSPSDSFIVLPVHVNLSPQTLPSLTLDTHYAFVLGCSSKWKFCPGQDQDDQVDNKNIPHVVRAFMELPHAGLLEALAPRLISPQQYTSMFLHMRRAQRASPGQFGWAFILLVHKSQVDTAPTSSPLDKKYFEDNGWDFKSEDSAWMPLPSLPLPLTAKHSNIKGLTYVAAEPTVSQRHAFRKSVETLKSLRPEVLCMHFSGCYCPGNMRYAGGKCLSFFDEESSVLKSLRETLGGPPQNFNPHELLNLSSSANVRSREDYHLLHFFSHIWSSVEVLDLSGGSDWSLRFAVLSKARVTFVCIPNMRCAAEDLMAMQSHKLLNSRVIKMKTLEDLAMKSPNEGWDVVISVGSVLRNLNPLHMMELAHLLANVLSMHAFFLLSTPSFDVSHSTYWHEPWSLTQDMAEVKFYPSWAMRGSVVSQEFGCPGCVLTLAAVSGHRNVNSRQGDQVWDFADYMEQMTICESEGSNVDQMEYVQKFNWQAQPFDDRKIIQDKALFWADPGESRRRLDRWLIFPDYSSPKNGKAQDQLPLSRFNVTLATHLDRNRLPNLHNICEAWNGPMSAVVMVTNSTDGAAVDQTLANSSCLQQHARLHLVRSGSHENVYGVNVARNTAMMLTQTEEVFLIDADFLPLPGTRQILDAAVHSQLNFNSDGSITRNRTVLVVLAAYSRIKFEKLPSVPEFVLNTGDAYNATLYPGRHIYNVYPLLSSEAGGQNYRDHQTHSPTDFVRWMTCSVISQAGSLNESIVTEKFPDVFGPELVEEVPPWMQWPRNITTIIKDGWQHSLGSSKLATSASTSKFSFGNGKFFNAHKVRSRGRFSRRILKKSVKQQMKKLPNIKLYGGAERAGCVGKLGLYDIQYSSGYEPYFVSPLSLEDYPLFDERFKRWGYDKQVQAHELSSRGYKFLGVPGAVIMHHPHPSFKGWSTDSLIQNKQSPSMDFAAIENLGLTPPSMPGMKLHALRDAKVCSRFSYVYHVVSHFRRVMDDVHYREFQDKLKVQQGTFAHDAPFFFIKMYEWT